MKVTRIAWAPYRIPFVTPYETAHGVATHRVGLILRLETDAGYEGLGEANLDPSRPEEDSDAVGPRVEQLAQDLLEAVPDEYDAVLEPFATGNQAARAAHCALETALADAGGRLAGLSIASMLAAQFAGKASIVHERVTVNATIAERRTEVAAHAALLAKAAGFGCVKLKVGMESTVEAEVARVRTIREVIGPGVKLRLDANGAWSQATAIATIEAVTPFDIELIEQPVSGLDELEPVRSAVRVAVAADEAVVDYASAERAVEVADVIVLKPMRLGGASVTRYLAQYAAARAVPVVVTTNIDTGIGTAMALQVAASLLDGGRAHGLATASLLQHDLLTWPIAVERGVMRLPSLPGLGVQLDDAACARYLGPWRALP